MAESRSASNPADSVLSPRLEQAKRVLERARRKARCQNADGDHVARSADRENLEPLPIYDSPATCRPLPVATQEELAPAPFQLLEIRGRTSAHMQFTQRCGQSPTCVRFEDESENEAEQRYLDRVRECGPVVDDRSQVSQQPKADILAVSQGSQGFRVGWVGVGIPVATLTNEGEGPSLKTVVVQQNLRRCGTCGSTLAADPAKDSSSKDAFGGGAHGQGKTVPRWVTPGYLSYQIIHPGISGGVTLTGDYSLVGRMDTAGVGVAAERVGVAGKRVSAFGKLRRRSCKGESQVEMSHGPYICFQELLAQRRNSRTRSSMEDVIGPLSKQMEAPVHVTFVLDTLQEPSQTRIGTSKNSPCLQLPIKSSLKSGSKNRQSGQHGVKQISGSLGMASLASQVTSAICMRPLFLTYSLPVLTPEPQHLAKWESVDPVDGEEPCSGAPCSGMWGVAMSKAEELRVKLLRAEHRKSELQWDDNAGKLAKGNRFSSMENLSSSSSRHGSASPSSNFPRHASTSHTPPGPAPKGPLRLQRTPSLQHLHTGSSLAELCKATSVRSLQSPKRKLEHPTMLGEIPLPLGLGPRKNHSEEGAELLDASWGGAPLRRLVQVLADGTLLLELTRPANRPFGFVISKGKVRPDPGIYVEQVGSSPTENIYNGLLGVGDEILEVNGEKVAGMSLDLVT